MEKEWIGLSKIKNSNENKTKKKTTYNLIE